MGRLDGKVALISGGARGLGASHARRFVDEGASVVIGDILVEEGKALADELGAAAAFAELDVTDADSWARAVEQTTERFGTPTILVNNAGIQNGGLIGSFDLGEWDRIVAINLTGSFLGCRAVADPMIAAGNGGSIINTSSISGFLGSVGTHGYSATKFAIRGLTKSVAVELAPHNIRCNSIHPAQARTDMAAGIPEDFLQTPLGRAADPAEITNVVLFLASDESSYCTGAEYLVDGGLTSTVPYNLPTS
ncbi:3-alpha-(or 20-beta)-hydroxysteroid dehydrogenase [Gordonia araii NBRC 100433]|uniref:3-alpha-(Or 20-beta)-hydroxysteroid dehydrogenase n=1 Tax=Gordonia araii NBRC 100433 TaxID=1073574 RepID=G7H1T9_9ACTN|nr:glucose 1-dehydrogenase [Gordonia araii]NNG97149.1 SDR family oxidoreductase [Gordonia araii NBRC 100433]GAB09814.1 3-alpha-(or 20-beta)-hydroxysteroid dehydrogenase [Gordonia araii NBRC 100433]